MRKCQVANEFVLLLGVAMLMIMLFLSIVSKDMEFMVTKKEQNVLRDIGFSVQNELFIAANVKDGYTRTFEIPPNYRGVNYNVSVNSGYLILSSDRTNQLAEYALPEFNGTLHLGFNQINKSGGVIYVS